MLQNKLNSDYLSLKLKNNLKRKTFIINFPRNGLILLGLRNVQKLIHSSKRDKNIKFFVQFSEDEKLRSFTAEKQSNKTSNHVKYLRVYVCA